MSVGKKTIDPPMSSGVENMIRGDNEIVEVLWRELRIYYRK